MLGGVLPVMLLEEMRAHHEHGLVQGWHAEDLNTQPWVLGQLLPCEIVQVPASKNKKLSMTWALLVSSLLLAGQSR